ncbi:MAG TPA: ArsR family transcriptional regulator [Thermoplasmatales archaeon]|nr:ArsR family transcriptional regulator [Thermoplasmatales archaeon]
MNPVKKILWWLLAASAGGINRGKIIELLIEKPMNANELAKELELDYKTVRHHLRVLEKNSLITSMGEEYAKMYFISELLEENINYFYEIWEKIGKNKIKKREMR